MSNNVFLFRPKPYKDECFTSYLSRVAYANNVSSYDIWRLLIKPGAHYPQSLYSSTLDFYPNNMIDIKKLQSMLLSENIELTTLTFSNILSKFGIEEDKFSSSRMLSGLTNHYRNYCPLCLKEILYYKLIWQVKEITFCDKHNIFLYSSCWSCSKKIALLHSHETIGHCSYCNAKLSHAPLRPFQIKRNQNRILEDWVYLIYRNYKIVKLKDLTFEQTLAFKLLDILHSKSTIQINISSNLKQIARNSKSSQTFMHLQSILHIIRNHNISMDDFFKTHPSPSFIKMYLSKDLPSYKQYTCLSPWCEGFKIPSTLNRTTTSVHKREDGTKYKYYMYCSKCGIEYCIDNDTNELIERGYFIKSAWNSVKHSLENNMSIKEMARLFKTTDDKVKRCIIFLATNKLIETVDLPLKIPPPHNHKTINQIKALIPQGFSIKEIRKELNLTYNNFLYYWFLPEIRITYIKSIVPAYHHKSNSTKQKEDFNSAVNYLTQNDIDITIKNISSYLNISPETLRYRGFFPNLKQAKEEQKNMRKEKNQVILRRRAKDYVLNRKNNGEVVKSEDIYNYLGVGRTVMVRFYPNITKYIHRLIKKAYISPI